MSDGTSGSGAGAARNGSPGSSVYRAMSILLTVVTLLTSLSPSAASEPRVQVASYWGGWAYDSALVARAPDGTVYLAGTTESRDLPSTRPAGSDRRSDVYLTALTPDAREVRRSTNLGGGDLDVLGDVTVDPAGNVLLVGSTNSGDFPQENAISTRVSGDKDMFVTKLSSTGEVVFSTFFGGSEGDHGTAVATDAAGNVYAFGYTFSFDFPTTPGALKERSTADSQDAALVKLSPSGELVYSTMLGGEAGGELGSDVVVDAAGSAYVSGWTDSKDFPTAGGTPSGYGGRYDAFVSKIDPTGSQLEFSTFVGGRKLEGGGFLAETGDGVAVALTTFSRGLTTTGFQPRSGEGRTDAYVALFSSAGALEAASYLGGSGTENPTAVGADAGGAVYVVGSTGSTDFPVRHAFQRRFGGRSDDDPYMAEGFVTKIGPDLSALVYSSFFGGSRDDGVGAVAVGASEVWLAGTSYSRDLPVRRALDGTWNGAADGWLARIAD